MPINNMAASDLTVNAARSNMQNASFSGTSGALGAGDRGAWQNVPTYTGNPYDSNDYVYRWRQYVHLYMTSWEARKIVRIPVEDALRKDWEFEGIDEKIAKTLKATLDQIRFRQTLSRSLMLERLLGGCLTFLGIEDDVDDPGKPYHPRQGKALRFCNPIPLSRIARITWDHDPLSENYMRPNLYLINSQTVHVSRCLVWDGDPLFDPYDFALTNFRSNLAGFGASVLATVWDDVIKAVGTRQAAYQMIQTNNAIVMAVEQLQDLGGTGPGNKALAKLEEIANNLSVYRAALVDGKKVDIKSHSASFGSVPELILTFIQILSAASDIPATRFIGQAPGGLNATGESDLENYYNVIDSMQHQKIEPPLRRVLDVIGYNKFKEVWHKERENLIITFPPLWNANELEESQTNTANIENVMKLVSEGLISDEKAIEEINAKKALSVILDETDIALAEDMGMPPDDGSIPEPGGEGGGQPTGPIGPAAKRKAEEQTASDEEKPGTEGQYTRKEPDGNGGFKYFYNKDVHIERLKNAANVSIGYDPGEWAKGMRVEREHDNVTGGDADKVALIVKAHLDEAPDYYTKLERVENTSWRKVGSDYVSNLGGGVSATLVEKSDDEWGLYYHKSSASVTDPSAMWHDTYQSLASAKSNVNGPGLSFARKQFENAITLDTLPKPSKAQASAGNYKKHHLKLHGLDFAIENPMGSERQGYDADGKLWCSITPAHYGYVKRTEGADGDAVDAYIGPWEDSELVFVVDQLDPATQKFDEHKIIFGCLSMLQAKELYLSGFGDGKAEQRIGAITPTTVDGVTKWLKKDGKTKEPFNNEANFEEKKHSRAADGKFGSGGQKKSPAGKAPASPGKEQEKAGKWAETMKTKSPADKEAFEEAKSLGYVVPPAWTELEVNSDPNAELRVKGRDAKGRRVYQYSAAFREAHDAKKFNRLKSFSQAYPGILSKVKTDMAQSEESRALYLISKTGFRIGSTKDTKAEKEAFGATTLRGTHIKIVPGGVQFEFTGKKGVPQKHMVRDRAVVNMVKDHAGKDELLFNTNAVKVRAKLKEFGEGFVVKDFRTYVATDAALKAIEKVEQPTDERGLKKAIMEVATMVSKKLGNTPQMARDSYIDPTVFKPWMEAAHA